jgi:hypothetical protein
MQYVQLYKIFYDIFPDSKKSDVENAAKDSKGKYTHDFEHKSAQIIVKKIFLRIYEFTKLLLI